jgi:hypothetical protein
MASDLEAVFDARGSDGQPFVCTVFGQDWRPRFVLKESFHLFVQFCRQMCGETQSSYGPEEQREATLLFPPGICCIQAYVPMETQSRYLAVCLRSPIKTMIEVYRAAHLGRGCFSNTTDTLDAIIAQHAHGENDYYQPLSTDDHDCQLTRQMTGALVHCLRKSCKMKVAGLVCEFVRDVQGDLYLIGASRCSHPQVKSMSAPITPCVPSDLERILGKQRPWHKFSISRRSTPGGSSAPTPAPGPASTRQATAKNKFAALSHAPLIIDTEERPDGKKMNLSIGVSERTRKMTLSIGVSEKTLTAVKQDALSSKSDKQFLDLDDPHTESRNLAEETSELAKGGVALSSSHHAHLLVRKRIATSLRMTNDSLRVAARKTALAVSGAGCI